MSEVTFAKSFLATLDKKPIKLANDHVSDQRQYPGQSPYILPKRTHPFPRKQQSGATTTVSITATLRPMRGGETVTIPDLELDSTIHDVKTQYAQKSGHQQDKVKVLLNKKPAADLKTLKELGVDGGSVEFSVMIMGGGGTTPSVASPAKEKTDPAASIPTNDPMEIDSKAPAPTSEKAQEVAEHTTPAAEDEGAGAILQTDEFWDDLKGFLGQRLRDQGEAERLVKRFRGVAM
ncbi:hypothetical protein MBLNU230_g7862t1 [Neophaeotheca triangularis]